jgi:hypothetical protein
VVKRRIIDVKRRMIDVAFVLLGLLVLGLAIASPDTLDPAEGTGSLRGQVLDPSAAAVPGARVEADGPGAPRATKTDAQGSWALRGLAPGTYLVTVTCQGFSPFARADVKVAADAETTVDASLALAPVEEKVNVSEPQPTLGLSEEQSAGAIVIEGEELDALPDDPDELLEALSALAGEAAGPDGGQVFVDGFSGGRIPPKSAIRQIRLNASPFSAEYDRPGFGRIEILTWPGSDTLRGQAQARFNSQALNTKDPYATDKPDYRRLAGGGSVSGPIVKGKASFFLDFDRRNVDDTQLVNATVLGPDGTFVPYNTTAVVPQLRTSVSPRIDAQLGAHTLTARYAWTSTDQQGRGIGGFSLPSQSYDTTSTQQQLQLGDTVVAGKVVNETRFQWVHGDGGQTPSSLAPALDVQDAFESGGAPVGLSSSLSDHLELQNVTSWTRGKHSFRTGFRMRGLREDDVSRQGFNGIVTFAGTFGPRLDASGGVVRDATGQPVIVPVTSIERYRRTLLLESLGFSPAAIRALGGGPSQLQLSGGNPEAAVWQWDVGAFFQDEWKLRRDLSLGLGLRYENQTNIDSKLDFAPRVNVSWSPGYSGRGAAKTVVRAGAGVFYSRVDDSLVLEARRLDGSSPKRYVVTDPAVLDTITFAEDGSVQDVPSFLELGAYAQPQNIRLLADVLRTPVTLQTSVGIDRALPGSFTLTAAWIGSSTWRALRSRVVGVPAALASSAAVAYQYESTGRVRQDQLILGINRRFDQRLSLSARYFLGWAHSDTDGAGSFPASSADPAADWSRSTLDVRQRLVLAGSVTLPWDVRVSPFVIASSGRPYNITIGRDINGDTVFADRPSFAADPSEPGVVDTEWGSLNPTPAPGEVIVPRNLGESPGFFTVNLRLSKSIRLRSARTGTPVAGPGGTGGRAPGDGAGGPPSGGPPPGGPPAGGPPPGGGRRGYGGGPSGGHGGFGGGPGGEGYDRFRGGRRAESGPSLSFSLYAVNLLNHVNPGTPVGNLSSPSFGESLASAGGFGRGPGSSAGNRSIELQAHFSF